MHFCKEKRKLIIGKQNTVLVADVTKNTAKQRALNTVGRIIDLVAVKR